MKRTLIIAAMLVMSIGCDNNVNDNKGDKEAPTEHQDRSRDLNEDGETKERDKNENDTAHKGNDDTNMPQ